MVRARPSVCHRYGDALAARALTASPARHRRASRPSHQEQFRAPQHHCARTRAAQPGAQSRATARRSPQGPRTRGADRYRGPDPARDDPRHDRRGRRSAGRDEAEARRPGLLVADRTGTARHEGVVHPGHRVLRRARPAGAAAGSARRRYGGHRLRRRAANHERRRGVGSRPDRRPGDLSGPGAQSRGDPDPDPGCRGRPVRLQVQPGCDVRHDATAVLRRHRRLPRRVRPEQRAPARDPAVLRFRAEGRGPRGPDQLADPGPGQRRRRRGAGPGRPARGQ